MCRSSLFASGLHERIRNMRGDRFIQYIQVTMEASAQNLTQDRGR